MNYNNQSSGGYAAGGVSQPNNNVSAQAQGPTNNTAAQSSQNSHSHQSAQWMTLGEWSRQQALVQPPFHPPADLHPTRQHDPARRKTLCPNMDPECGLVQPSGMYLYCFKCLSTTRNRTGYSTRNRSARIRHRD
ncbi:hypothetical protein FRC02_009118 [Tulasnella sp. 418]|nr:hypothetical protein FRC02_009118 [Tulasnella sp. 418]